jgi:hypothetical protein
MIHGQVSNYRFRNDIYVYVHQHKDSIELVESEYKQSFVYYEWGFLDAGINYGYFYSPNDEYQNQTRAYRNGYLKYGTPYSGEDWCYFERICDNWYYYEEHYG